MKRLLATGVLVTAAAFAANLAARQQGEVKPSDEPAQVIEVTAKKYEYSPGEIRVKKGTKIRLKVRALDRTHGLEFKLYPEGAAENGPPGLRFAEPQSNWKIEKDQERIIEFVAERAGTYSFKCSLFCGLGHRGMKGKLVVEE